jgi:PAS domain S-box-containing protein/putative nucleotidyltransferase with HDIG domain
LSYRRLSLNAHRFAIAPQWLLGFAFIAIGTILAFLEMASIFVAIALCLGFILFGYGIARHQLIKPLNETTQALGKESQERIRVEARLKTAEEQLLELTQHSLQGITIIKQGKVLYANDPYCVLTGYRPEELLNLSIEKYLSSLYSDDFERVTSLHQKHLNGIWDTRTYQFRLKRRDGKLLWLIAHDAPFEYEGSSAILTTYVDITEQMSLEEALTESEKRYRSLLEASSDAIFIMDGELFTDCNRKALDILSCTREQIIGQSPYRFSPQHQPDGKISREKGQEKIQQAFDGASLSFEWLHCRYDGTPFNADVSLSKIALNDHPSLLAIVRDISERKYAESQIKLQLERLRALHRIDIAISSSMDLNVILNVLLDQLMGQLGVDAADVLLLNQHLRTLEYTAGRGFRHTRAVRPTLRIGEGYAGQSALERRIIHVPSLAHKETLVKTNLLNNRENFYAYVAAPLIAKGQVKGVLEVFHRVELSPDPEWFAFLETLSGVAAIAIDNLTLFNDLQRSNMELSLAYDATIEGWSRALDLRDKETEGHTQRVTEMTIQLARRMGIPENDYVHIRWGSLLHDIGKMGVPDEILLKPGPLTDEEWLIMRKHPIYAFEMLSPISFLHKALDIPYCHHEKWDGSGYPRGLRENHIPLTARIFSIVDIWDALGSNRPYRQAWPFEKILDHIKSLSGTHFDPQVVEVFLSMINSN